MILEELGWFRVEDTLGLSGGEGGSACGCINHLMLQKKNSPATVMVRGPSRKLPPTHSTIVPSTTEASDSEVRVAVRFSLESVRTPRNSGLPCVSSVLLELKVMLNPWSCTMICSGVTSHRMALLGRVQMKVTVSSGQATVGVDVSVAATNNNFILARGSGVSSAIAACNESPGNVVYLLSTYRLPTFDLP